jgi:DNA-binding beta-propeller fold protein YncE
VSSSGVITSTTKPVDVNSPCSYLEYCNDKLFLSLINEIQISNIKGQELKTIKHDSAGVAMFKYVMDISLSPDGQTIYVTDLDKSSVTSMTLDGNVKAVYKDKDLKEPAGITVDKDGYVYVRSTDTRSIHQLTADLSRVQIIIEDVSGRAITFSSTENKLYLSDGKCVSVYDLMKH